MMKYLTSKIISIDQIHPQSIHIHHSNSLTLKFQSIDFEIFHIRISAKKVTYAKPLIFAMQLQLASV